MTNNIYYIDICLASDGNYIPYMCATMLSVLKNSLENEYVTFHLLISEYDLTDDIKNNILDLQNIKKCTIKFYNPDLDKCKKFMEKSINKNWPLSAFYRLQIPSLIKDVDKLLYLDCDMIVTTNLSQLFCIDMEDNLAIVTDSIEPKTLSYNKSRINFKEEDTYFCSGFLLMRNKIFIEENFEKKYDECLKSIDVLYTADEDILNIILKNKVKFIENEWAYIVSKWFYQNPIPLEEIKIIHYGGPYEKPWKETSVMGFYYLEWWKYFVETIWFKESPIYYIDILIKQNINIYDINIKSYIENINTEIALLKNKKSLFDYIFSIREDIKYKYIIIFGIKITIKNKGVY
ncbi:glycosyltransferase family 8 protein [Brachyspira intermedia]|uniref:glycosyltransferase family 8 protein n=1 Tax=Brachyspira intermedia TaxID=84377 RepID=UPI00300546DF